MEKENTSFLQVNIGEIQSSDPGEGADIIVEEEQESDVSE